MALKWTDTDKGAKAIFAEIKKADRKEVAVGILAGSENDGVSIAEYAAYNEYGTDNTPSRRFMAMSVDQHKAEIKNDVAVNYSMIVSGKLSANTALKTIGLKHVARIQKTITQQNILPRLAASTVAGKKGSTKTLVHAGALANAVQMTIRPRGTKI